MKATRILEGIDPASTVVVVDAAATRYCVAHASEIQV